MCPEVSRILVNTPVGCRACGGALSVALLLAQARGNGRASLSAAGLPHDTCRCSFHVVVGCSG